MKKPCKLALLLSFSLTAVAQSQTDHWVGTWSTAPLQTSNTGATTVLGAPTAPAPTVPAPPPAPPRFVPDAVNGAGRNSIPQPPTGAAMAGPTAPARPAPPPPLGSSDITLAQIVHISIGGSAVRVVFTNEYGTDPLTIASASASPLTSRDSTMEFDGSPVIGTSPLTFGGKTNIVIPPGSIVVSDPVTMKVPAFSDLEIGIFLPAQKITYITRHTGALQTSYTNPGNLIGANKVTPSTPIYSWTFLKSVDVLAPANAAAVVAFGDSITDGAYATRDANARWPDDLARRLAANPATRNLSVLNEGIGGNRVLHDNTGPSALARFTRDALDQAGVKYIIFLEAINDIGHAYTATNPNDVVTADDLIQGYQQMIERAHLRGVKVIGATLTPYTGASYASPAGEQVRQAVYGF